MKHERTRRFALTAFASTLLVFNAGAQTRSGIESFYVTSNNSRIVDVEAVNAGVKVRVIDIDARESWCGWQRVVRAHEVVIRDVQVAALAAVPVCTLSQRRVDRALERSREDFVRTTDGIPTGVDINTVVASCRGREHRLVFDSHLTRKIDGAALRRVDPTVYALWTLDDRILARAPKSVPDAAAQETLGTAAAADLVAGKYDAAYRDMCWDEHGKRTRCSPGFWTQILGDYAGPPKQRNPLPVELADHAAWQFVRYVPPVFPPIALSARVHGDVQLRLDVERATGAVTQAALVKGIPLLNEAALTAARQWRFVPGTHPADMFEVTLRFELRCSA